ncbi:MAG TPA: lantibiotic dehydratase family protein, partial [Myxococcaceae bacterium]|nr:lantibiotic dehydratase family protein [Myxococcaceae bacterium]
MQAPEAGGDVARLEEALARDRAGLRQKLREQLARPELRDALFVASPELEASLPIWLEQPESERGQKIERALVRYFARMAVRPTPFGLFAGCSLGRVGAQTLLTLADRAKYQRHTRLDMDYLFALSEALGRDPSLRAALKYRPGSSLYRAAGRLRYAQARLDGKARSHHLVAVEPADYLLETLQRAQGGATLAELARALVTDEIPLEEAEAFIGQLTDAQLLESELPPAVTGPEPVHGMISLLRGFDAGRGVAEVLDGTRQALEALDRDGLGAPPSRYRDVARGLEPLPAKVELPRLFQVDLVKPAPEATLGPAVLAELWRGVELLHAVAGEAEEALDRFREAFTQRYEGREVPLLEALDEEAGVGFGTSRAPADASPLLQGLPLPSPEEPEAAPPSAWTRLLLAKLDQAVREGRLEVTLDAPELEALRRKDVPPLPDALSVLATLVGAPERIAAGDFLLCVEGASSSPARLLGRFCHADPELHREVEALLREEEALRPDAVFAEIVHLPEGRVGNVLCRPVLRPYELPYLGHSGAPEEARIPPSDLRVRVVDGRIVLRSAKLDREVLPRLSSAHNYSAHSVTVYRFLCMLQDQGVATRLGWSWGPLSRAPFLPRVRSGRVVLARARWRLEKPVLRALGGL